MGKFFSAANIFLYFLSIVVGLILGMFFAAITGAAEGQGLAGGAIILWYGIFFAIGGFVFALILTTYTSSRVIITANRVLTIVLGIFIGVIMWRFYTKG